MQVSVPVHIDRLVGFVSFDEEKWSSDYCDSKQNCLVLIVHSLDSCISLEKAHLFP